MQPNNNLLIETIIMAAQLVLKAKTEYDRDMYSCNAIESAYEVLSPPAKIEEVMRQYALFIILDYHKDRFFAFCFARQDGYADHTYACETPHLYAGFFSEMNNPQQMRHEALIAFANKLVEVPSLCV